MGKVQSVRFGVAGLTVCCVLLIGSDAGVSAQAPTLTITPPRLPSRGGVITLTFVPAEGVSIGTDSRLQRLSAKRWEDVGVLVTCQKPCKASSLRTGDTTRSTAAVPLFGNDPVISYDRAPAGLKGRYRVVKDVRLASKMIEIVSNTIVIG